MTADVDRDALEAELARERSRLESLRAAERQASERIRSLEQALASRAERAAGEDSPPAVTAEASPAGGPRSAAEKVRLFRALFRGRDDVHARRWSNARTGRQGYAPVCAHEWQPGLCGKPRVRCGECPHRAFLPLTDAALLEHLQGRHTLGLYPLLPDESCWLLAIDFDQQAWREDVGAFVETCRGLSLPVAVERSRSGNGAHLWFFFSAPVPARLARQLGSFLLTETMSRRHQLTMASYDRLFPSQDTLPKGGFGNLIALPLQHTPRQQGNTVFLDSDFAPYPDQWAYLAALPRLAPAVVEAVVREAEHRGLVMGVKRAPAEDPEPDPDLLRAPWAMSPSRAPAPLTLKGPLPATVRATLSQRLFVEKAGLPSSLLSAIQRLAAFQNPEFYQRQSLRLSTARTPRIIACAEELPLHLALPRGCREDLAALLDRHGSALLVDDQREAGHPLAVSFRGELTGPQRAAAQALLPHDTGVFVAPPGSGKTVLATHLIAARARSTLVLVHRQPLLAQWTAQLASFLGLEPGTIGQIGDGKDTANGTLDVAMVQSLVRRERVDDRIATYGHVVVDECHHIPAVSFELVLSAVRARFLLGLTATPQRRDGRQPITEMQLGPVRLRLSPGASTERAAFRRRLVRRETGVRLPQPDAPPPIQALYALLAADGPRNQQILDEIGTVLAEGRAPLVLTERTAHLEYLAECLRERGHRVVTLRGGQSRKRRAAQAVELQADAGAGPQVVVATGRYVGEGFDCAHLDTLLLALPISWKGTLQQYAGRLHREHPGKAEVRVIDYVDAEVPALRRMFERRLRGYRAMGYRGDDGTAR